MKLTGFVLDHVRRIAALENGKLRDLGTANRFYADPHAALARPGGEIYDANDVLLTPAVPETARIFCVGINYRSHAGESKDLAGIDEPKLPMVFGRWQSTLVVDGTPVPVPPNEDGLDWEVELAVVMGGTAWNVSEDEASTHILGYAAFNDLSARRKQLETPQFTLGKNADFSGPMSPIVTVDEIGDIKAGLDVKTLVNGEVMQEGNTRDLIHGIARIISYISDTVTLRAGDVIATGTPGGVGAGRKPPVFLRAGDEVLVSVERVGSVRNPIVAR
jgi:2-keto-4-pentenoate hydratase/2-oxohepta-3-ene-1,7-dioic acid hydratase in catechol pathway